jgi:HEAT repeat protein
LSAWVAQAAPVTFEEKASVLAPNLTSAPAKDTPSAQTLLGELVAQADRPGAEAERAAAAAWLLAKAADTTLPQPARVFLVLQVERIGAGECVPGLTALLNGSNAELRECARRALEKNPAPAAVAVLRAALQQGGDVAWKTGLIHSLGQKRDAASVSLIVSSLANEDLQAVAADALGKIATPAAQRALEKCFAGGSVPAGQALVALAGNLASAGQSKAAVKLYEKVYASDGELRVRLAALAGLAKNDPENTQLRLQPLLESEDVRLRQAALAGAVDVYGTNVGRALAAIFPRLSEDAKLQAMPLLDGSGEARAMAAAQSSNERLRQAAVEALARFGSAPSVPLLLPLAAESASRLQKAAAQSLVRMPGNGVSEALILATGEGATNQRCAAIRALAGRGNRALMSSWMTLASDGDPMQRAAACEAIGMVGGASEFPSLLALAMKGAPSADAALRQVIGRMTNKTEVMTQLIDQTRWADAKQMKVMFDLLAGIGSAEALDAVAKATSDADDRIQDVAVRAMANWSDFAATKPLLALAENPQTKPIHNTLAIEAVTRFATGSDEKPAKDRYELAARCLKAARRVEDKRLALSAIGGVPSPKGGKVLQEYLTDAELKNDAGMALANLAESLPGNEKVPAMEMARALKSANLSEDLNRRAQKLIDNLVPKLPAEAEAPAK